MALRTSPLVKTPPSLTGSAGNSIFFYIPALLYRNTYRLFTTGCQTAFGLSPIAAYLPQYLTLIQDGSGSSSVRRHQVALSPSLSDGTTPVKPTKAGRSAAQHHSSSEIFVGSAASAVDVAPSSSGTPKGPPGTSHALRGAREDSSSSKSGESGGFSPISILILLVSHMLRLVYFWGCVRVPHSDPTLSVQIDLIVQSLTMISVQLLLVHATARTRRVRRKRHVDERDSRCDGAVSAPLPRRSSLPWSNVWNWDSLRPHLEFYLGLTLLTVIFSDTFLFRYYRSVGVKFLLTVSIVLESCLALPQLVQNWRDKHTEGLSVLMVCNWAIGDAIKLGYFSVKALTVEPVAALSTAMAETVPPMATASLVLAWGCVLALFLDAIVLCQVVHWYPTREMTAARERAWRAVRHFFANKDDGGVR